MEADTAPVDLSGTAGLCSDDPAQGIAGRQREGEEDREGEGGGSQGLAPSALHRELVAAVRLEDDEQGHGCRERSERDAEPEG